ncbi:MULTISPECIES: hypothetical protein [Shewanella]|uniref:Porin n=1 Tax=Shewanella fidelis TaxID=173509 RepID=A0AAW8NQT9_9GAMM|nr:MULTISPECIES: hypothetical protein [Shewanella]MDR8525548.1 hypothetical protein [Shewanella fidelis]MDW4813133.1 hypothetical protein [Shewanella fidelis]MDW4816987.1 hypothetical protein [Shewanella fidelis]MDW4820146.1 hypothetical protein [Shewanella fidelis]MDW4825598.1 hypothetical protein [Shewanella fidelis]
MKKSIINLAVASILLPVFTAPAIADDLKIGGSVRANYSYIDYSDESKDNAGDFDFNLVSIKVSDKWNDIGVAAEYRFMKGYDYLKYGYGYWEASDDLVVNLGAISKPFGNKNYASHNWWYSLNYYLGFEDDYGVGASVNYSKGASLTEVAFIKGAVYGGTDHRDFAGTVAQGEINGTQYNNEEKNTLAARQSYTIADGDFTAVLGASVEYGQLYNTVAGENGDTLNYAAHIDLNYDGWGFQAQYLAFDYDQYDDGQIDPNKIGMGMLDGFFEVASKGNIYTANLSKKFNTSWGSYTLYNDFSMVQPDVEEFDDSLLNTTGVSISYGPLFVYVDYYMAKNVVWLGGNSLGLTQENDDWDQRFNINLAYYF